MTSDQDLLLRTENGVGYVTFNRPDVMNAVNPEFLLRLIDAVRRLEEDGAVRVIVLTGAGRAFSAGGDRAFLRELTRMAPEQVRDTVYAAFLGAVRAVKLCEKPTVASVNGPAVGAGCELAVACDFRLASSAAFFWENWTDLGLIPALGGMFLLPRLIGLERAANMVLRGVRVSGEEAVQIGLATACVAPEDLASATRRFADELAARPRRALQVAKQGLRRGLEATLAGEQEFSVQAQAMLIGGADFAEAVSALEERRKPAFP